MSQIDLNDPDAWSKLGFVDQREALAVAVLEALGDAEGVREVLVEAGVPGREYDLTVLVETDVGRMRTPIWSHARATIFADPSIHAANRRQLAPAKAVAEAADRLRRRLGARYALETRGLTITLTPEDGVERTWVAERSRFRNRTAVIREDRIDNAAADIDLRDLLAHFYSGPSLRVTAEEGEPFLLPAASEAEGPQVTLCPACGRWEEGAHERCSHCGAPADVVVAARPPKRLG